MSAVMLVDFQSGKLVSKKEPELGRGQIVWLNGYGQDKQYHERQAVISIENDRWGTCYKCINLDRIDLQNHTHVRPESELFGIGIYYTPGDIATEQEIREALAKLPGAEAERKRQEEEKRQAAETERQRVKAEYSWLPASGSDDYKTAAANIRLELKKAFPGVKFSVRKSGYDTCHIDWDMGPTVKAVEKIVGKYTGKGFDGMQDLEYSINTAFNEQFGSVGYLFTDRNIPDEVYNKYSLLLTEKPYEEIRNDYDMRRVVHNYLADLSFIDYQEHKKAFGKIDE